MSKLRVGAILGASPKQGTLTIGFHFNLIATWEIAIILFFQMRNLGLRDGKGSFPDSMVKLGLEFRHWDGCSFGE